MKPLLNVVTAVSRPENLPIIARHVATRLPSFRVRWYCVADGTRTSARRSAGLDCYWWGSVARQDCAGGQQRNAALDRIRQGLTVFLDDDNTLHPEFDAALSQQLQASPGLALYVFGQQEQGGTLLREARPDQVRCGGIDVGQIVVRCHPLTKGLRFVADKYHSDWLLIEALLQRFGANWPSRIAFGPPATFYNALRTEGYDWPDGFSSSAPVLEPSLRPLQGRPARGLEIGSWEGRSARWFLENVLTHDESRLVCIEPFVGGHELSLPSEKRLPDGRIIGLEERLLVNLRPWLQLSKPRVELHGAPSWQVLPSLPPLSFDFARVGGSHRARDVLEDLVLTHRLLKPGGLLIADDYGWTLSPDRPANAIDAFLSIFCDEIEVLHKGCCVVARRRLG
jgi:hypothetical protein